MRVCLVGTLPDAGREIHTGPERTTIGLAEALAVRGHDVEVLADEGTSQAVATSATVLPVTAPPGVTRLAQFGYQTHRVLTAHDYDIVHAWRPVPGLDVLSLHSVGMVAQVEGRLPGTFSWRFRQGARVERLAKRLASRRASQTITTAPSNAADARRFGFDTDGVIPVGVSEAFLTPDRCVDEQQVLCVGRIEPRKQQQFVAENTPDDYSLRLAGPSGDRAYTERVTDLTDGWEGALSPDALVDAYSEASVFVIPSVFEGFGLTAVEAMAAGTPVVAADTCGVADIVAEEDVGAVFEFGDADDYRRALEAVVRRRDELAERARRLVRRQLTWNEIAQSYERVYQSVSE
ncbi:glycosyltransferase family 4 protein [Halobaculum sp. MBLA0143]|uniref:glycosyltransferase family 4 protein n=1 Tax=Halobaculum sp. MBLA0143 TaxID=3079933 RepID=UPI003523BB21